MAGDEADEPVATFKKPVFKKKGAAKANVRKRARPAGDSSGSDDGGVVVAEKKKKAALNSFSTGEKRQARAADVDDDANDDDPASAALFKSTREAVPVKMGGDATSHNEAETATDRDARAILERAIALQADGAGEVDGVKVYRGQAGYKQHIAKSESQVGGNKHTGTQGPIRAPQYARTTCVFDYQPDLCKDYKETGYCGFGDSCKFMHDRGDYKAGWQQEAEWNEKQKKKREATALSLSGGGGGDGSDAEAAADASDDDRYAVQEETDLPFACYICREPFRDPVVTNCGHYFCERCALQHYRKSTRCAACGKQTGGVFNYARRLVEFLAKKGLTRTTTATAAAAAAASGEEDFTVREEIELTSQGVSSVSRGGWHTVTD
jgi:RING finger protein 113A